MGKDDELYRHLNTHNWKPEKGKSAVLLIDLQEYFRAIIDPVLENILKILSHTRKRKIPLYFTQHGHEPGGDKGMLGAWWSDHIIKGSNEARLLPELKIGSDNQVIPKNTYSAFYQTDLEEKLKERHIQNVIIGGVMTNLCCETTARDAFVRNFRVFFLADGTSTVNEDYHFATLKNLSYGFATLLTCEQFVKLDYS
jgi:isochorismate hydrolase